jgi:hypothetical protein
VLRCRGGLTLTEDPQADAEKRTRSAHRAIEIREMRRRVLLSRPARITLALQPAPSVSGAAGCRKNGPELARICLSAARCSPSPRTYGLVTLLPG